MIIKELSKSDIKSILQLYKADFPDGWTENMLSSAFDGGRFLCLGAFDEKTLIGVLTCSKGLDDVDLEGIVTASKFRKKGVARALLSFAEQQIKRTGATRILLEVRRSNAPAISFYINNGFNQISVRKKYYSDGEDALVFVKEI